MADHQPNNKAELDGKKATKRRRKKKKLAQLTSLEYVEMESKSDQRLFVKLL